MRGRCATRGGFKFAGARRDALPVRNVAAWTCGYKSSIGMGRTSMGTVLFMSGRSSAETFGFKRAIAASMLSAASSQQAPSHRFSSSKHTRKLLTLLCIMLVPAGCCFGTHTHVVGIETLVEKPHEMTMDRMKAVAIDCSTIVVITTRSGGTGAAFAADARAAARARARSCSKRASILLQLFGDQLESVYH